MSYMLTLVFVAVMFLVHVPTGNGLTCWICTSDQHENCFNPSSNNPVPKEICRSQFYPEAKFICRVVEFYSKDGRLQVSRACAEDRDRSEQESCDRNRLVFFSRVRSCSSCMTDLCKPGESPGVVVSKAKEPDNRFSVPTSRPNVPPYPYNPPRSYDPPRPYNDPPRTYYNPPRRANYDDDYALPPGYKSSTSTLFQNKICSILAFIVIFLRKINTL